MVDIWITITTVTYYKIMELERPEQALALYFFYYTCAKNQQTNQPWATISFCMAGLGWGRDKVKFARRDLRELGLIEDIRKRIGGKTYTKLKFITNEGTIHDIFSNPSDQTDFTSSREGTSAKCLKNKKYKCLKKKSSKDDLSDLGRSRKQRSLPKIKVVRKKPKIVKKQNESTPDHNSKYSHSVTDLRNYNEIKTHGATNHRSNSKAELDSLDKLHALFSTRCKNPYFCVHVPEQYIDFEWDMDELIDTFKFQLAHAQSYNIKPIKSIGKFILCEGYNGGKSWSPLLYWHQKKNKTSNGELSEEGKRFLASLKRTKINNLENLESTIINKVAKELFSISDKYELMDGSSRNMSYPFGIVDCLSKYIREKTNKLNFKLVYITKNGFVDEFLSESIQRNIIKKRRVIRRGVN